MTLSSPLAEANPKSLDELFAADPTDLSDADIDLMVKHLRENRHKFQTEKARKVAAKAPLPAIGSGTELLDLIGLTSEKK